jgi:serine/threonine protein kinase
VQLREVFRFSAKQKREPLLFCSDVWALGVMLLELAYGCCPYKPHEIATTTALKMAVTNGALLHRVLPPHTQTPSLQPQTPSSHIHTQLLSGSDFIDDDFTRLVEACLQPLPQNRPSLAQLGEFAFTQKHQARAIQRLSAWLGDSPTFAQVLRAVCAALCGEWHRCNSLTAQDERMFLEQEHDERANTLATRVVTTGGVMQVRGWFIGCGCVLIACQIILLFARQIFGGCNEKGRWDGAFPVKSSPIIVKEKER